MQPDFHCSFFYRDELRKLGWKADVLVPWGYPENLLYTDEDIIRPPRLTSNSPSRWALRIDKVIRLFWFSNLIRSYRFLTYYGAPNSEGVAVASLLGKTIVFLPTGCLETESKANFSLLDGGHVCDNCGFWDRCDDRKNNLLFERVRKYCQIVVGDGSIDSTQFAQTHMRYKSISLSLWSPEIDIPEQFRLPPTENLRILHSNYLEKSGRNYMGRNIKGTPHVVAAVERLRDEGFSVEMILVTDVPSKYMRFYQAQADIVVEQLIYGWWGSTGVETMALGKPVVCYLRPSWKQNFLKHFPEYTELPIVEADTKTIYDALRRLVVDTKYRAQAGQESRKFAESHFDPRKNAQALSNLLLRHPSSR